MKNEATLYSNQTLTINGKDVGTLQIKTKSGVYQNVTGMNNNIGDHVLIEWKHEENKPSEIIKEIYISQPYYIKSTQKVGSTCNPKFADSVVSALEKASLNK